MENMPEDLKNSYRKKARDDIADFENGSMVGIQHMGSVADSVGKPIKVVDKNGKTIAVFGTDNEGEPMEVQYHEPGKQYKDGHFTLPGGKDPPKVFKNNGENDCLFNVLAFYKKIEDPSWIREDAARAMRKNIDYQAMQINDVERLRRYRPKSLREGGMTSISKMPADAATYLTGLKVLTRDTNGYHLDESAMAGTYEKLSIYSLQDAIEINHTPPKHIMIQGKDTENTLPCITMLASDHRLSKDIDDQFTLRMTSTGSAGAPEYYRKCLKELLGKKTKGEKYFDSDKFADALVPELIDLQLVSMVNKSCDYRPAMNAYIAHCKKEGRLDDDGVDRLKDLVKVFPLPGDGDVVKLTQSVNDFKNDMKNNYLKALDVKVEVNTTIRYNLRDLFDQRVEIGLTLVKDSKIKPEVVEVKQRPENYVTYPPPKRRRPGV